MRRSMRENLKLDLALYFRFVFFLLLLLFWFIILHGKNVYVGWKNIFRRCKKR